MSDLRRRLIASQSTGLKLPPLPRCDATYYVIYYCNSKSLYYLSMITDNKHKPFYKNDAKCYWLGGSPNFVAWFYSSSNLRTWTALSWAPGGGVASGATTQNVGITPIGVACSLVYSNYI